MKGNEGKMEIFSPSFKDGGAIPMKYSQKGENISPPLKWKGAPSNTKSFALIMHDNTPLCPGGCSHWVVWNIPPTFSELPENVQKAAKLSNGICQGLNIMKQNFYVGPNPPFGINNYTFYIFALDTLLNLDESTNITDLQIAMMNHVLATGQVLGRFSYTEKIE